MERGAADGQLIAVVCDGMGGENCGQIASSLAVRAFLDELHAVLRADMTTKIHSPLPRDGGGRGRRGPQPVRHDAGGDDRPVERGQRMFLMRYNIVLG